MESNPIELLNDFMRETVAVAMSRMLALPCLKRSPPQRLYHYTNASGLVGILGKKAIWATHYSYLNDPSETKFAHQVARGFFAEERAKLDIKIVGEKEVETREELRATVLEARLEVPDLPRLQASWVASFSGRADLLGQWRAYANDGRGFAIGIDHQGLLSLILLPDTN